MNGMSDKCNYFLTLNNKNYGEFSFQFSKQIESSICRQTLHFIRTLKTIEPNRYAAIIFHRLIDLDSKNPSWEYNWVTQVRQGLSTFGLDSLLLASTEDFLEQHAGSIQIIHDHFKDHDNYSLERVSSHQYAIHFKVNDDEQPEDTIRKGKKEKFQSIRWCQLPWYLKSNLSLQHKKLIAQLRQDNINLWLRGKKVMIPSERQEIPCTLCNENAIDCAKHALFDCPTTAKSAQLNNKGWNRDAYFEFLSSTWAEPEEICNLVLLCFKIRAFIISEAEMIDDA